MNIPPSSTLEVDLVADNLRDTLFHCHQQLHVDFGFMQLLRSLRRVLRESSSGEGDRKEITESN